MMYTRRPEHRSHTDASFYLDCLLHDLVLDLDQAVPFLPSQRNKKSGLRRRHDWEKVWDLQRQEDAIDARTELPDDHPDHLTRKQADTLKAGQIGDIPKPPKYRKSDCQSATTYSLRGKLDVPRERFTLYPDCAAPDATPVISWAGLNHLQRARAVATFYYDAKDSEGWPKERLVPLLAGLKDLLPWLEQWQPETDPDFGMSFGEFLRGMLDEQARELGVTPVEVEERRLS